MSSKKMVAWHGPEDEKTLLITEENGDRLSVVLTVGVDAEWADDAQAFSLSLVGRKGSKSEVRWRVYARPNTQVLYLEYARGKARSLKTKSRAEAVGVASEQLHDVLVAAPSSISESDAHPDGPTVGEEFAYVRAKELHRRRVPRSKHHAHGPEVSANAIGRRWRAMALFEMVVGSETRFKMIGSEVVDALEELSINGNVDHVTADGVEYRGVKIDDRFALQSGRPFEVSKCPGTCAADTITLVAECLLIANGDLSMNDRRRVPTDVFQHLTLRRTRSRKMTGFHPDRFGRVFQYLDAAEERVRNNSQKLCRFDKNIGTLPLLPKGIAKAYFSSVWAVGARPGEPRKMSVSDVGFTPAEIRRIILRLQGEQLTVPMFWADRMPHGCWVRRTKLSHSILAPMTAAQATYMRRYLEARSAMLKAQGVESDALWVSGHRDKPGARVIEGHMIRIWREADIMACEAESDELVKLNVFDWHEELGRPRYEDDVVDGVQGQSRVRHALRHTRKTLLDELGWKHSKAADWLADWDERGNAGVTIYTQAEPAEMQAIVDGSDYESYRSTRQDQGFIDAAKKRAAIPIID